MKGDIKEIKGDVKEMKGDIKEIKEDTKEIKEDTKNIRTNVAETGADVKRLVDTQAETLNEVRALRSDFKTYVDERLKRLEADVQAIKQKLGLTT
jgi:chromosome segregation ATPase